jgi:superfamily I DNA/RNA helicase
MPKIPKKTKTSQKKNDAEALKLTKQKIYDKAKADRNKQTEDIQKSLDKKKVIVAGPGTGKTYLFQNLLKTKSNNLALTFVNALVDELSLSLFELSEVRTLHGYALSILWKKGCKLFPKLPNIIEEDAQILINEKIKNIDFKSLFQQKPIDEKLLEYYKQRKDYYGKYYGFSDIIYALIEYFKDPKNKKKIPTYEQIVIDEFQDFNELEVELIELLAKQSPVLITGDDDQSLYIKLKNAHPKHLRKKHGIEEPDYFPLPLSYCSRSTEVIVKAINDFISTAITKGFLKDRVKKLYNYFPCEKMDKEGEKHSKINFRPVYARFLSDFLKEEISNIAAKERKPFEVLIIVPNVLKNHRFPQIIEPFKTSGFRNVHYSEKIAQEPSLIEGLSLLLDDPDSNLGWRIIIKAILEKNEFEAVLKKTKTGNNKIYEIVDEKCASAVRRLLGSFQKVITGKKVEDSEVAELLSLAGYEQQLIAIEKLQEDFYLSKPVSSSMRGIKGIKINITTIMGSKGLEADYVFLTDFSDKYFSKNGNIEDQNIHDFIVAMTRARKKIYLISPDNNEATFLSWIKDCRIERQAPFLKARFGK